MRKQIHHLPNRFIPDRGVLFRALILILGGSALGIIFNLLYPKGLNPFLSPVPEKPGGEFIFITLDVAKQKLDTDQAIFIDARSKEEFKRGHIPGAFNITISDFATGRPEVLEFFPEDAELIVYCDSEECETSEQMARLLIDSGFKNVKIVKGGWENWLTAGFPVENKNINENNQSE